MILDEQIAFVKDQQGYHERQRARTTEKGETRNALRHEVFRNNFGHLQASLEQLNALLANPVPTAASHTDQSLVVTDAALAAVLSNPTQVSPQMLEGLPPQLLEQLSISETDRFQWQVVDLINRTPDKIISIEVLLIALFRATGKVLERTELSNRIYRMMRKKMIYGVSGKKGWYTTVPTDEPQLPIEEQEEETDPQN
jgi:hypothetical protein